jgi:L-ascorbate metabolism protein UlaG (beta-lactamase superfamily)
MVTATWLGHAAWEFAGSKAVVIVDPFLDENPVAAKKASDVKRADVVLVSHDHFDHMGDAPAICKSTGATLVATYEVAAAAAEQHGIKTEGMNIGGSIEVAAGVRVHMTIAFHTSGRGHPTGWVIEMDGVRIYHTGDTCLFGDMRIIGEIFRPDLLCLPIGDRFTMGPPSAARAVELVGPRVAIPMHYNTWPPIAQDPEAWKKLVAARAPRTEVVILKPGGSYKVEANR